jgi:hypothetical protein
MATPAEEASSSYAAALAIGRDKPPAGEAALGGDALASWTECWPPSPLPGRAATSPAP